MILNEGGNIFQGTEPFDHKIIPAMMKQINSVTTKTGAKALPIGSGASPTPGKISGDLDMIIDAGALFKHFNVTTPKDARIELEKLFQQAGYETKRSGTSVHVKTTAGKAAQQVDIMVVANGDTAQKFHVHDIPKGSPYKGVHKQILIADLAKNTKNENHPEGMKWSAYKGLLDRRDDAMISNNLDEIAKILLGGDAKAKDLASVEAMVAKSPMAKDLVDKQEQNEFADTPWKKSKVAVETLGEKQLRRLKELLPQ